MDYMYLWLVVLVITIIAEVATATALVTIWFSIGALFALLFDLLNFNIYVQVIIFLIASVLCLIFVRPLLYNLIKPKPTNTNADRVINQVYTILQSSDDNNIATLKANGLIWNARSFDNSKLMTNDRVLVKSIEGSKLIVEKI